MPWLEGDLPMQQASAGRPESPFEQETSAELGRSHQPGDGQALPEPLCFLHTHTCSDLHTMAIVLPTVQPTPHKLTPSAVAEKSSCSFPSASSTTGRGGEAPVVQLTGQQLGAAPRSEPRLRYKWTNLYYPMSEHPLPESERSSG